MKKVCLLSSLLLSVSLSSVSGATVHNPGDSPIYSKISSAQSVYFPTAPGVSSFTLGASGLPGYDTHPTLNPLLQSMAAYPAFGATPPPSLASIHQSFDAPQIPGMAAAVQAPIGTATPVIMQFQAAMREKEILTAQLAQAYTIIDQLNSRLQADKQELGDRSAAQARSLQAQVALLQEAARANEKERRNLDVEVQSLHFRVQKLQSQLSARDGIENRCRDLESTIAELEYQNARISAEATALRSREPESDASAPLVFSLRNENEALRTQNGNLTNQLLEARTQYDVLMGQLKDVSRGPGVK